MRRTVVGAGLCTVGVCSGADFDNCGATTFATGVASVVGVVVGAATTFGVCTALPPAGVILSGRSGRG